METWSDFTDRYENAKQLVTELLTLFGLDPSSEGMLDTPRRFVDYLMEYNQSAVDLVAILKSGFENPAADGGMVVQTKIPFRGACEHHLLPFMGNAAIGYIPKKRVVGLSKLARLVDAVGTLKPSTQEEITNTIADTLNHTMEPLGVIVVTSAAHTCMSARGVNVPGVITRVSAIRGAFLTVPPARQEFFSIAEL